MLFNFEFLNSLWVILHYHNLTIMPVFNRLIMDNMHNFFSGMFNVFLYLGILVSLVYLVMSLVVIFSKERNNELKGDVDKDKLPFVTIQIPTKNEIIALRCAKRCLEFDYPKDKYEILIGDDSDDISISKRLAAFAKNHKNVKVIKRKTNEGFKPGNLNNLLKYSKGEILVIFDSDFAPKKDFLKRIVRPFEDKRVSAVQARWKFFNPNKNLITVLATAIVYTCHHVALSLIRRREMAFICGSAEAVRKKDLIELGGWRPGSLTEDIEFSLRLHKNGKKIVYLPMLECLNEAPSRPIDLYKQQMRWAHGVVSAYKLHMKDIIFSKNLTPDKKLFSMVSGWGYIFPLILSMLLISGMFSFLTHRPEPLDIGKFAFESVRNILLTCGVLIASGAALYKSKKMKLFSKMILSSFSFGLVTVYYVNIGIIKALLNKPMQWHLLKKSTKI